MLEQILEMMRLYTKPEDKALILSNLLVAQQIVELRRENVKLYDMMTKKASEPVDRQMEIQALETIAKNVEGAQELLNSIRNVLKGKE